jgi:hypothetical protein
MNPDAQRLGRLAAGRAKTLTPAALAARRKNIAGVNAARQEAARRRCAHLLHLEGPVTRTRVPLRGIPHHRTRGRCRQERRGH